MMTWYIRSRVRRSAPYVRPVMHFRIFNFLVHWAFRSLMWRPQDSFSPTINPRNYSSKQNWRIGLEWKRYDSLAARWWYALVLNRTNELRYRRAWTLSREVTRCIKGSAGSDFTKSRQSWVRFPHRQQRFFSFLHSWCPQRDTNQQNNVSATIIKTAEAHAHAEAAI